MKAMIAGNTFVMKSSLFIWRAEMAVNARICIKMNNRGAWRRRNNHVFAAAFAATARSDLNGKSSETPRRRLLPANFDGAGRQKYNRGVSVQMMIVAGMGDSRLRHVACVALLKLNNANIFS